MKKSKRILALIGAVLLLCLYGSTLIFAFVDRLASSGPAESFHCCYDITACSAVCLHFSLSFIPKEKTG